ncbi:MAG: NAD(P)/FAD-dependent oxidoreductase [Leptothrix sp. (in: b-proteobacteria)]
MTLLRTDQELALQSYYAATTARPQSFAPLEGDQQADVAIIGGGLAGLSAAIELAERGRSVILLEANQIGWGASGRNGGQAIHGLACDQSVIEAQLGIDDARRVWSMTIEAITLIRERCQRYAIDCEWQSGHLTVATNEHKARALLEWADHIERSYDYLLRWIEPQDMPRWLASPRYHSGYFDSHSGHLNPLKYCLGLARAASELGVRIFEKSPVISIKQGRLVGLRTTSARVRARQVLLAGNVYLQGLAPELDQRIMPVGTYIVCSQRLDAGLLENLIPSHAAVSDSNFVLDYFRPTADHRLMYGGRVSYSTLTPHHLAQRMRTRMLQTFPQLKHVQVEYAWGGFVDITMNRAPDFGRLPLRGAGNAPTSIYYLQGFSGHGLALTGLAGKLVAEAMTGDSSRFDVFAKLQHRNFPGGRWLRTPSLVLGMLWYRLRDLL